MPGGGDFVSFFRPRGRSFAVESCPRGGDFDGKNQWPGGQPGGGMVTGQIDTCIRYSTTHTLLDELKHVDMVINSNLTLVIFNIASQLRPGLVKW